MCFSSAENLTTFMQRGRDRDDNDRLSRGTLCKSSDMFRNRPNVRDKTPVGVARTLK